MAATSLDLSQVKTDALSSAATFRALIGLGTLATVTPTGTPDGTKFLRDDNSWQAVNLSAYLPLAGGTLTGALTITQGTANTSVLTSTGYSLTGANAQSLVDLSGTWNTTGTPTLIKANVTDTASNAASLLMDLQVGGTSRFRIGKNGQVSITTAGNVTPLLASYDSNTPLHVGYYDSGNTTAYIYNYGNGAGLYLGTRGQFQFGIGAANGGANHRVILSSSCGFSWSSQIFSDYGAEDLIVFRDAANTLAQRNSTNAQTFRLYNTFTSATSFERGKLEWASNVFRIGTEKGSAGGSARAMEFQTDGTTRLTIASTGAVSTATAFTVNNASGIYETGSGRTVAFTSNFSASTPGIGTTSNHDFCVYTNGANERLRVSATGLITIADALNIAVGTTTGTKIGTGTTQKIGFFDATPVVQQTAVADATDAASVITQLNALLTRVRNLGLIAT